MRISKRNIESALYTLNRITGNPEKPYRINDAGHYEANIGNYHLSQAYGGYQVQRMVSDGGGTSCPITQGHVPARECYDTLHAFMNGYEQAMRDHKIAEYGWSKAEDCV